MMKRMVLLFGSIYLCSCISNTVVLDCLKSKVDEHGEEYKFRFSRCCTDWTDPIHPIDCYDCVRDVCPTGDFFCAETVEKCRSPPYTPFTQTATNSPTSTTVSSLMTTKSSEKTTKSSEKTTKSSEKTAKCSCEAKETGVDPAYVAMIVLIIFIALISSLFAWRAEEAKNIFSTYLSDSATDPVNVDSHARKQVKDDLENPNEQTFEVARKQAFYLVMKFIGDGIKDKKEVKDNAVSVTPPAAGIQVESTAETSAGCGDTAPMLDTQNSSDPPEKPVMDENSGEAEVSAEFQGDPEKRYTERNFSVVGTLTEDQYRVLSPILTSVGLEFEETAPVYF